MVLIPSKNRYTLKYNSSYSSLSEPEIQNKNTLMYLTNDVLKEVVIPLNASKQTPSHLVHKRTIPTERPLLVGKF
jgi:hypothetical protein